MYLITFDTSTIPLDDDLWDFFRENALNQKELIQNAPIGTAITTYLKILKGDTQRTILFIREWLSDHQQYATLQKFERQLPYLSYQELVQIKDTIRQYLP